MANVNDMEIEEFKELCDVRNGTGTDKRVINITVDGDGCIFIDGAPFRVTDIPEWAGTPMTLLDIAVVKDHDSEGYIKGVGLLIYEENFRGCNRNDYFLVRPDHGQR